MSIATVSPAESSGRRSLSAAGLVTVGAVGFLLGWANSWARETEFFGNVGLGLALAIFVCSSCFPKWKSPYSAGTLLFITLFGLYLTFSVTMNAGSMDLMGTLYVNNAIWWGNYVKICCASAILGLSFRHARAMAAGIGGFCAGSFSVALLFSAHTILTTGNTVHGAINNPLDGVVINSSGIMSLTVFLPAFASALAFYKPLLTSRAYWAVVVVIYTAASCIGYAFNSRSVFLFLYFGLFIQAIVLVTLNKPRTRRSLLMVFMGMAIFLSLIFVVFFNLRRPISAQIFADPRFAMVQSFVIQLIADPLAHARVPAEIQVWCGGGHFFHNFFADAHRLSGFLSFLFAALLAAMVCVRTAWATRLGAPGRILFFTLLPTVLVLNTSVIPEGEFQPIALLLMIGGAAEGILRRASASQSMRPLPGCPQSNQSSSRQP